MTTVIAAIDNSTAATPVLAEAKAVSRMIGASVVAVHAREDGYRVASEAARASGVPLTIVDGDPSAAILECLRAPDVAGVVLGARGSRGGIRPTGHVAHQVITAVDVPAVVVPPEGIVRGHLRTVLLPLSGDPRSAASIRATIDLADASGIHIVVVHVYDETSIPLFNDQPLYETEAWAREFVARYVHVHPSAVRLELRIGLPEVEILDVAAATEADLIALGWSQDLSPGHAELVRALLGRTPVPLLLVPVAMTAQPEGGARRLDQSRTIALDNEPMPSISSSTTSPGRIQRS